MELEKIPNELHHLVNLVSKWGINDDGFRDEYIDNSSTLELSNLISSIKEEDIINLNKWLSDELEIQKSTDEYINYTCFAMAIEYTRAVLKSRKEIK
jgi:hypothetical protein